MGDDQHGQTLLRELEHNVEYLANHLRVQRRGDLIEEHHLRMHLEGPHDRDTLLLSTGQHTRISAFLIGESNAPKKLSGLLLRIRLRTLLHLLRCHRDVIEDRFMREKIIALEYHADLLPVLRHLRTALSRDFLPVEGNASLVDRLETVDAAEQCRLAAAGRPEQDDDLTLLHIEVDSPQDLELAERFM